MRYPLVAASYATSHDRNEPRADLTPLRDTVVRGEGGGEGQDKETPGLILGKHQLRISLQPVITLNHVSKGGSANLRTVARIK